MAVSDERMTIVYYKSGGKWIMNASGEYEWEGKVKDAKGVIFLFPPTDLTYRHLVEELHSDMNVDKGKANIQLIFNFSDGLNISIGYEFDNKAAAQEYVRKGAVKACFGFSTVKSDKKLWELRCKFYRSGCAWKLRIAAIQNSERFSVRSYNPVHSCRPVSESKKAVQGSAKLVRDYLKEEYAGKLETPTAKEIVERVKVKYGASVSYMMALRGKYSAEYEIRGSHDEHYSRLPGWLHMLTERNSGTIAGLQFEDDKKTFKYLFIALGATIKRWKYMRKVVAVDATFLTSQYKGALIVATAQDGDHHQYPLAWGVIDRENDASWLWFMTRLSEVIPDGPDVVVLSDRHKSIIKAAREVYKHAQHGFCVRHIAQNLKVHVNRGSRRKSSNGETVSKLFFKCAAAYTIDEFEYLYDDLKSRYPKVAEYMQKEELAPENWARCKFKSERYNMLTTNGAESINSVLKKAKKYPLLSLLDICLGKTVEWFNRHRLEAGSSDESQKLTPFVYKELHERYEKACTFDVQELNGVTGEFEVRDDKGRRHLVNLGERTCGCKMFDVDRYPCSHAIAAAHMIGKGDMIYELCSEYYRRDTWRMAYQETVYPVPDCCDWKLPSSIADVVVLPPIVEEKRN
ncbi:PREDICTED: uncharacterized protein LOC104825704 [Tarenaya hassleriana]|uniref:uncharacterized protein LOC104825704 n=1 Tax=Tarenaya hassleriana TaxID=28532 RepID=UPI00053C74C8|nr:PREDICTED: uncharacterized protein LOC104825704 [Tarenaya hassleriana]